MLISETNAPKLRFFCFLMLLNLSFLVFYSTNSGPVGEFGNYAQAQQWDALYSQFFRPLSLNLVPAWMIRFLGSDYSRYTIVFACLFTAGLATTTFLMQAFLRWMSSEKCSLLKLSILVTFGFSNVFLVSTLMVQYTTTDFLFMMAYALFLLSVVAILNAATISIWSSLATAGSLAMMCASKEFTLFVPGVILLLLALRFHAVVALLRGQPGRSAALFLLLGLIAGVYVALLLTKPTFVAAALAGSLQQEPDFTHPNFGKFLSNILTCSIWLTQAPLNGNYPYVFNPLPLLGPVSYALSWIYAVVLIGGSAIALITRTYRRAALFQLGAIAFWILIASSNNRALSSYLAPAFLHAALLWALGALEVLKRLGSQWAIGLVKASCLGILIWSMWLGSATLYSPKREISFHGAMVAADAQYRAILRVLLMSHDRFVVTFDTQNAPDYVFFHMATGGALSARQEVALDGFTADSATHEFVIRGRRPDKPSAGDAAEVLVKVDVDPLLGSHFRIVTVNGP